MSHDRARFVVTLVGIIFAVVLVAIQVGLFLGFTDTITALIRLPRADIWVMARGTSNFEIVAPIHERDVHLVRSVAGVERAERMIADFSNWQKPRGGDESVLVIGFDPNGGMAGPWNVVAGRLENLRLPDSVMIDELSKAELGVSSIGDAVEMNHYRARVVGFTHGVRSFTTSPVVFTSIKNALKYTNKNESSANYIIVKSDKDMAPTALAAEIKKGIPDRDVYTTERFADISKNYWMFTTGAGSSVMMGAALGLIVGVVIVAQVLYATTVDHLWEFGTLRAMGAPASFIVQIILSQAMISAAIGHAIGISIAQLIAAASRQGALLILIPPGVIVGLFAVTLAMCLLGSLIAIRKVLRLDPAMVFQR